MIDSIGLTIWVIMISVYWLTEAKPTNADHQKAVESQESLEFSILGKD